MTRYIAFLRAINVGRRTVRMDRLREVFEAAGFDDVATYIASGNVIFAAAEPDPYRLEREIERLLAEAFGFHVDTFRVHGREVYWLCRTKTSESAFSGAVLEKALGMPATLRNANTVRKIADLYCGAPPA